MVPSGRCRPGHGRACLNALLGRFTGLLQCDGYAAYDSYRRKHPGITLAACWAHVRRKLHEGLQISQPLGAGPLKAFTDLYAIETGLRHARAGPFERSALRGQVSATILSALRPDLVRLRGHASVSPKRGLLLKTGGVPSSAHSSFEAKIKRGYGFP